MKNLSIISKRFRNAFAPALVGAVSLLFAATSASGQNLISWYTLNGDGTDQSSNEAHGTLTGNASFVNEGPGEYGGSLSTVGSGANYLLAPTGNVLNGLDQLTISLWVNMQGGTGSKGDRLLSTLNTSLNGGFDLRFTNNSSADNFKVIFSANSTESATSNTISSTSANGISGADQWVFVAVTYDSTLPGNNVRFYLGNEAESVITNGVVNHTEGTIEGGADLNIGDTPAVGEERTPPAYISDVRIYDGVLSLEQIEDIRASVAVIPEPAHFAAIFGGIILAMLYLRRRKS